MLKSIVKKILGFFSVAQTEREIENVEYGSGPGWTVLKVHGREVYVPRITRKENGVTVYITNLSKAHYCELSVDPTDRSGGHLQPHKNIKHIVGPLSEEDHNALVRKFERLLKKDEEEAKQGNPVSFKRELIRRYPPRPTEDAGSHPQIKSDAQPR